MSVLTVFGQLGPLVDKLTSRYVQMMCPETRWFIQSVSTAASHICWLVLCRLVNMAFLATVGGRAVNGVAAIHSEIIKEDIFPVYISTCWFVLRPSEGCNHCAVTQISICTQRPVHAVLLQDFVKIFPEKFQNKTNGVTPRRWLAFCNPELSALITETLGSDAWMKELDLLQVCWRKF